MRDFESRGARPRGQVASEKAGMSPRTFARIYTAKMGITPAEYRQRFEHSRSM